MRLTFISVKSIVTYEKVYSICQIPSSKLPLKELKEQKPNPDPSDHHPPTLMAQLRHAFSSATWSLVVNCWPFSKECISMKWAPVCAPNDSLNPSVSLAICTLSNCPYPDHGSVELSILTLICKSPIELSWWRCSKPSQTFSSGFPKPAT